MRLMGAGAPEGVTRTVKDDILTWANLVTLIRLMGLPLFAWLAIGPGETAAALWVLVAIAATDWVDGYLARRLDQVSVIGTAMDPVADRLMIFTVALVLAINGIAPWWVLVGIVVPDLILGTFALVKFHGNPRIAATRLGKIRTALLMIGLPVMMLTRAFDAIGSWVDTVALVIVVVGLIGHWVVGAHYLRVMIRMPAPSPSPGPTAR
ncbi:CDP-diacylglycerol--glycerol-3-phosphate 3-phosphatidyltransferase [Paraoerskovia marina]|uniref:CDP-diacylglycerol--glycerol-3-phosphate 3-phosphatidyltransferase n=1 Tax=Paraoerskovia marina TaxID=545619 RepID=A0A1H1MC73_9CELL|nr:CDP-alcohol phosphatidyltransferase family protein [Paraoerskovia marina]SDR84444.1 CDP-diacylglycerol--glycerol-3-phosphate 3-phosphatidyltransferase [Paraoerskovia marina]